MRIPIAASDYDDALEIVRLNTQLKAIGISMTRLPGTPPITSLAGALLRSIATGSQDWRKRLAARFSIL